MKTREERRRVMINARIRSGATWQDACILNISSRGVMLQAAAPPKRGSYLEVRRGRHVIIGRVMWTFSHRVGLQTQDRLPVEAIIAEPDSSSAPVAKSASADPPVERRAAPRSSSADHERSRIKARAFEFLCLAAVGVSACMLAFGAIESLFAAPLLAVAQAL